MDIERFGLNKNEFFDQMLLMKTPVARAFIVRFLGPALGLIVPSGVC
jgi:hypothetical protein